MKFEDLKKEPKVNEWLDAVNPKPVTEKNYLRAMEEVPNGLAKLPQSFTMKL
jgi:hypothetical protein